jgi:DNA polymerase III delta subunit
MAPLTAADVRKQLAARAPAAVYVLTGPDEREKSALATAIADLVEPELRAFNVERFYGADASPLDGAEAARTLPMMGDRRAVVVMQAERMLNPKRKPADGEEGGEDDGEGGRDAQSLVDYLGRPNDRTVLVFVLSPAEPPGSGKGHDLLPLNGALKITKALARHATVVVVGEFGSEREVVGWLQARAREAGLAVEPGAAQALVESAGGDPAKFRADVERVLTFARGERAITVAHVEAAIVAHETSSDDWAIARAIERGDAAVALREARVRLEDRDSPFAMLGQLAFVVRTPPPRGRYPSGKVARAVDALFRTDLALKSSYGDARALIERLIVELCE